MMKRILTVAAAAMLGLAACERDDGWQAVTDDDPRLEAAREQARETFPEFAKEFKGRKPMWSYTAEVKVEEGTESEYLSIDVLKLTDTEITGVIIGYPRKVKLQSGATVTVPIENVADWRVESPEGEVKGGYVQTERERLQRGG